MIHWFFIHSFVSALEAAGSFTKATVKKLIDALQRQHQQCDQTPKFEESGRLYKYKSFQSSDCIMKPNSWITMYTANTRNHNIRKTMLHDCLQLSYASIIDRCSSYVTACGTVPPITIEVSDIKTYFYDAFN